MAGAQEDSEDDEWMKNEDQMGDEHGDDYQVYENIREILNEEMDHDDDY